MWLRGLNDVADPGKARMKSPLPGEFSRKLIELLPESAGMEESGVDL